MVRSRGTNTLKHKHEEHEDMQLSLKEHLVAFPFKDQGVLVKHPLICHHQRGIWLPRKCKKVKGEEEKITTIRGKGSFVPNFLD